jgi:hypothetical protein
LGIILILCLATLAACRFLPSRGGGLSYNKTTTIEAWTVKQPDEPKGAATLVVRTDKGSGTTGDADVEDQGLAQLSFMPWLGAFLVLGGIAVFVLGKWIPFLRLVPAATIIATGAAFIAAPVLIDRYIWIVVVGGLAAAAFDIWSWLRARKASNAAAEPQPVPSPGAADNPPPNPINAGASP